MSERSLPDELRSVLLAHSLDAPDPDDTVARTLAETIDATTLRSLSRRRRRDSAGLISGIAVAAVCAAVVGGVVVVSRGGQDPKASDNAQSQLSRGLQSNAGPAAGPAAGSNIGPNSQVSGAAGFSQHTDFFFPEPLNCPTNSTGATATFNFGQTVQVGGVTDNIVSGSCPSEAGARSADEVYTSRTVAGRSRLAGWIIRQSDGFSVQSITSGPAEITVAFLRLPTSRTPASLEQRTFRTSDGGVTYQVVQSVVEGQACDRNQLSSSVTASAGDGSNAILRVSNRSASDCVLSGYPGISGARNTLRGDGGGTNANPVPIVRLGPGQSASAAIDRPAASVPCPSGTMHPTVTLPDGNQLTGVTWQTEINCRPIVHPFVSGTSGTD